MIILDKINKSFDDKKIINDVSFEIDDGDFFLIKGESGKGKTTILNMIGMLEQPDSGTIVIDEVKNPKINEKSGQKLLQEKISYLFQNYGLVDNETIYDNLSMALEYKKIKKKEKKENMLKTLKIVGLEKDLKTKIYSLSGGEQQRIAIAKILLKKSKIILCDEPTGSLDEKNRDAILAILLKLNELGITIVMVSHDKIMEKHATQIYAL